MKKRILVAILSAMMVPSLALAWTYTAEMDSYSSIGGGFSCAARTKGYGESVTDASSPSPSKTLRGFFYENMEDGGEPYHCYRSIPSGTNAMYWEFYIKFGSNYQFHPTVSKFTYSYGDDLKGSNYRVPRFMTGANRFNGDATRGRLLAFWGGAIANSPNYVYTNVGTDTPLVRGQWYKITVWADFGTPGNYDGSFKMWLDGVLKLSYTGKRMMSSNDSRMSEFSLTPVWGGNNDINSPAGGMDFWVDKLTVSSEAISGSTGSTGSTGSGTPTQDPATGTKSPNPPATITIN